MVLKTKNLFYYILIGSLFQSCNSNKNNDKVNPISSAKLNIQVFQQVLQSGSLIETPLKNVTVFLYLTEAERTSNDNVQKTAVTNDSGKVVFNSLPDDYYYITTSHPTLGFRKTETATPNGSISYEDIIY